jgi:hypothetical protein
MEVDGCREIGTELKNFENIPFRGCIWSSTSAVLGPVWFS